MRVNTMYYVMMVEEMERAIRFYREVMGLSLRSRSEWWSELTFGDGVLALHGGGDSEPRNTGLGFRVTDVHAACAEIEAGGGKVIAAPSDRPGEGILLATAADTEGNAFSLTQTED